MRIKFLLSLVVVFLFSTVSYGQIVTWTGAVDNDISKPNNWTTNKLPTTPRTGIINACVGCPNPIPSLNTITTFNSINIDKGEIQLNDFELITTALSITSGKINSNNGKLTTGNLSQVKESLFVGDISIVVNGKGACFGKNIFQNKLNIELSASAGGNLVLNQSEASTYIGKCNFVNNSTKSLTIASYLTDTPTIFQNSCKFTNNNTGTFIVSSKPKINFIEISSFSNNGDGTFNGFTNSLPISFSKTNTFSNTGTGTFTVANKTTLQFATDIIPNTFSNTGTGTFTVANNAAVEFLLNTSCINTNGTFTLATGTSTVLGVGLTVENGKTTNLLSSNAIGTFNSVSLTNTASNSTITTASATTTNKLNINNGLSVVFATGANTINLNKVICGISASTVTINVLSSANLTITASTFNGLSITDNSNNAVTINTITCLGNFLLEGTSSVATNISGVNTFGKNITIDKAVNISGANIDNIKLITNNQFINSANNIILTIPRLNLTGKTTINTLVNIANRLTIGGVVDCLSGTLSNPKLHIADGATISGAGANAFIMGAVKKTGLSTSYLFPVGTIRVGQTPENKYTPLTLISPTASSSTDFITVAYVLSASTHPNTNIISGSCEYWGFNSNFDGQRRFTLTNTLNFCTTRDNGTGLSAFHWADNIGNWADIATTFSAANQTITSTNTRLVVFKANKNNEIALGYGSLLKLDLSEVAVKDFTLTGTNIVASSISPPAPLTNFKSGLGSIFISPKFVGTAPSGILTLKFTDVISSELTIKLINPGLLNTTPIANTNNDVNIKINGQTTTLNNLYKITNTSPQEATIKFYKIPQIAPSTALGITSNLVNGIRLGTSLTFNFPVVSPSQPQFRLDIVDASNNTPITNITTTLPNLTLTWTPATTLAPGTYKFTLTDLSSSKVYNGQFIKQ